MLYEDLLLLASMLCVLGSYQVNSSLSNEFHQGHQYMHQHQHGKIEQLKLFSEEEETSNYWLNQAQDSLKEKISKPPITGVAKNVIMFIGDGMSISTLTAARTYLGQLHGRPGEETLLSFEKFPFSGLSKTYCVNQQVADSACSATAYLSGVKNNAATIGVTGAVKLNDCIAMQNISNHVHSIAYWSQLQGKQTGIVTTTAITDASPAGTYAHTAQRDWQNDADVVNAGYDPERCPDIATQLLYGETGKNINVVLGGGRGHFLPSTYEDEEGETGYRTDNRNLIEEWEELRTNTLHDYVYNKTGLLNIPITTEYLLGLFHKGDMQFNLERDPIEKPSLADMTEVAIKLLSKGDAGYFLFVEGGLIDHAHHGSQARKALDETVELHKAIEIATQMTSEQDTLIVVTSDHAHTMTINGSPSRGNDILGIAGTASDNLPYSTISYANGPGYRKEQDGNRHDISNDDLNDKKYRFPALVPLDSETHAGDDVAIFARGPWSHLFSGVNEQHLIPHIVAYASCVGNGITACN